MSLRALRTAGRLFRGLIGTASQVLREKTATLAPYSFMPLASLKKEGFRPLGRKLLRKARKYAREGKQKADGRTTTTKSGRPKHRLRRRIQEEWRQLSYQSGSQAGRVYYGTQTAAARFISNRTKAPLPTVINWKPEDVNPARKKSDVCPYCAELLSRRLEVAAYQRKTGGQTEFTQTYCQECPEKEAKDVYDEALQRLGKRGREKVQDTLDAIAILEWHQNLAHTIDSYVQHTFLNAERNHVMILIDWGANVPIASKRSTSHEWYDSTSLLLLGAAVSIPKRRGKERETYYHHAYDVRPNTNGLTGKRLKKQKKNFSRVSTGIVHLVEQATARFEENTGKSPDRLTLVFDTAKHFRSKRIIYFCLHQFLQKTELIYSCENHGKTRVDSSFRAGKMAVKEHADYSVVKQEKEDMLPHLQKCYEKMDKKEGDYRVTALPEPQLPWYGHAQWGFAGVNSVQDISLSDENELVVNARFGKKTVLRGKKEVPTKKQIEAEEEEDEEECPFEFMKWCTLQEKSSYVPTLRKKRAQFF